MSQINVGLVGLGFMGQMHFGCYERNPGARVVAVCDQSAGKFAAGAAVAGNIEGTAPLDFSELRATESFQELLDDPTIDLLDLCLPTPLHARATIAALEAGKHVLCEKPMAPSVEECDAMIAAAKASGKLLMIGHCLRFWPCYVAAHDVLARGELGRVRYARFGRSTQAPRWSQWMLDGQQSGGALLDTHIHDIDTALWWFGPPAQVRATGVSHEGLSLKTDATWLYPDGLTLSLHCGWDLNGGPFRMSFEVMGDAGTLAYDSALGETLLLHQKGQSRAVEVGAGQGYEFEIAYLLDCIGRGEEPTRATPQSSRQAIRLALEEKRAVEAQSLPAPRDLA